MRYSDLEKQIPEISQRMLSRDLRKLEKNGILTRTVINDTPIKVEYKLTMGGVNLGAILHSLYAWEQSMREKECTISSNTV